MSVAAHPAVTLLLKLNVPLMVIFGVVLVAVQGHQRQLQEQHPAALIRLVVHQHHHQLQEQRAIAGLIGMVILVPHAVL